MPAGLPPFPSPAPSSSLFENRVARPGAYLKGAEAPFPIKTVCLAQWLPKQGHTGETRVRSPAAAYFISPLFPFLCSVHVTGWPHLSSSLAPVCFFIYFIICFILVPSEYTISGIWNLSFSGKSNSGRFQFWNMPFLSFTI